MLLYLAARPCEQFSEMNKSGSAEIPCWPAALETSPSRAGAEELLPERLGSVWSLCKEFTLLEKIDDVFQSWKSCQEENQEDNTTKLILAAVP